MKKVYMTAKTIERVQSRIYETEAEAIAEMERRNAEAREMHKAMYPRQTPEQVEWLDEMLWHINAAYSYQTREFVGYIVNRAWNGGQG